MAKKIKIAATCRRCRALPEDSRFSRVDGEAIACIESALHAAESEKPDLVVLPEMCDLPDGWSMEAYVSYIAGRTQVVEAYVREAARRYHTWIAYPTVRQLPDKTFRNSCLLLDRKGDTAFVYDKLHPTMGELEAGILPGDAPEVFDCELGRIGIVICFDLNYLELALEYQKKKADLMLFPSLFGGERLQKIWALCTRAWMIGACGGCMATVVSPAGEMVETSGDGFPELYREVNLDCALVHLDFNTEKLAQIEKKYGNEVQIYDPGGQGFVLAVNEGGDRSLDEILEEYSVEKLDDYLNRMECEKSGRIGKSGKRE